MKLISVYREPRATRILYELLAERPESASISHEKMPSRKAHAAFVRSRPYRYWFLIEDDRRYVGDVCVTRLNEIGITLLKKYRVQSRGTNALGIFMSEHEPLPTIPAKRAGTWLANVAMGNFAARAFFHSIGFKPVQITFAKSK